MVQIVNLSFELECEKNKNKQKEAGIGAFFKKNLYYIDLRCYLVRQLDYYQLNISLFP